MGVPEEIDGPARKRPRLSLRTSHKSGQSKPMSHDVINENASNNTKEVIRSSSLIKSQDMSIECRDPMADIPSLDPVVAPVASLHNLGNTCFLNSVLEVLRYTPGFLDGLIKLHEEILTEETASEKESSDGDHSGTSLNWQVVKNTYTMYQEMNKREQQHKEIATSDASSMAIRPSGLLDNIRELNPIFEGHFQHDAQELLQCLLCYIEDAEKELVQLRKNERIKQEKMEADIDIEPKLSEHMPHASENIEVGLTARGATSNNQNSLKSGECQDLVTRRTHRRQKRSYLAVNASMKNTISCDKNTVGAGHDKVMVNNKINGIVGHTNFNGSDNSVCLASKKNRDFETDSMKLSPTPSTNTRNRKRSRLVSNNILEHVDHVAESTSIANSTDYNKKAIDSDNSAIVGKCKEAVNKVANRSVQEHSTVPVVDTSVVHDERAEVLKICSSEERFNHHLQNKFTCLPNCNSSSKSSTEDLSGGINSAKPSILSLLPFNTFNRLHLRRNVTSDPISQTSQSVDGIHVTQVYDNGNNNNNNSGDINNNSNSLINNNDSNCNNSGCAAVHSPEKIFIDLTEEMSKCECQSCPRSVSPLYVEDSVSSSLIRTPSKTVLWSPVKSPAMIEHSDEISIILKNMPKVDSAVDSVTRQYLSSQSHADFSLKGPSTLTLHSTTASDGFVVGSSTMFSSEVPTSSHLHVLEPNKEINVTVWQSPKKQYTPLMSSYDKSELFVSSCDEHFSDHKLPLSLDERYKLQLASGESCDRGKQNQGDNDSVLKSSLGLTDTYVVDGSKKFTELLPRSFNFIAPYLKDAATWDMDQNNCSPSAQSQLSRRNLANRFQMLSNLSSRENINACRSPGASCLCNNSFLQPKLELKKCDWLAVSPVRSTSARKAMLAIARQRRALENNSSVRRKILCDDSQSSSSSSLSSSNGIDNHTRSDLGPQEDHKQGMYSSSEINNKNNGNSIKESAATMDSKVNEVKKKSQLSILNFTRKSTRKSKQSITFSNSSHASNKVASKCTPNLPGRNISLKPLSVTLDNCDWLLGSKPGKFISAKQAIIDIERSSRTALKSRKSNTETSHFEETSVNTGSSFTEIKPQSSPRTVVGKLFGGTMMHQTKCLECEVARQRQEVFRDISVPVRSLHSEETNSDDDSDDDDGRIQDKSGSSCLSKLIQAFSSVERLIHGNKYFCEHCLHYVEAERSCHYLALPAVLTIHLKRFRANRRLFGGVSKLVDKVAIPQNLPCLQYQCRKQCSESSHKYSLFAIVTHSGTSILHGHYRTYVKVQAHVNPSVFDNLMRSKVKSGTNQHLSSTDSSSQGDFTKSEPCCQNGFDRNIKTNSSLFDANGEIKDVLGSDVSMKDTSTAHEHSIGVVRPEVDTKPVLSHAVKTDLVKSKIYDSFWLECDDECIKVMDEKEFSEKLLERDGSLIGTPYVLFYHKLLA